MTKTRLVTLAIVGSVGLSACSGLPPQESQTDVIAPSHPPRSAFERDKLAQAQALARKRRHGEAAEAWELLNLYRPDEPAYEISLRHARQAADRAASQHLGKARSALAAGNEQQAVRHYLLALANDPQRTEAADELRDIERTRNRRYFLGKPTRLTIGRANDYLTTGPAAKPVDTAQTGSKPETRAAPAQAGPSDRSALEHAALLERDGEFTEALAMLTRFVKANPDDDEARAQIARTWEAFGDRALSSGRPRAALRAFERAQTYHPDAASRLDPKIDQLKRSLGQS